MTVLTFPEGFLWGVATAGHQIEGGNTNSDIWFLEQQQPTVFREPSGKACNSWEMWDDDLQLVAVSGSALTASPSSGARRADAGRVLRQRAGHYTAIVDRCHGCLHRSSRSTASRYRTGSRCAAASSTIAHRRTSPAIARV
jgi:beta-glucosidase